MIWRFSRLPGEGRRRLARPKCPECAEREPGTEDLLPIEQLGHEAAELLSLTNGGEARSLNKLAELAAWQVPACSGAHAAVWGEAKWSVPRRLIPTWRSSLTCSSGSAAARWSRLRTPE